MYRKMDRELGVILSESKVNGFIIGLTFKALAVKNLTGSGLEPETSELA